MSEELHAPPQNEGEQGRRGAGVQDKLNFFDEGSPFFNHPLLTAERTAAEVDFLETQLVLPVGARILDVGCGFGRHSIELARRGYRVVGIDPSAAMIAEARKRTREAAVTVDFRQAAGQTFRDERPFEAAICLFTTLGQISQGGDNSALVSRVYQALKPDGLFVVEVPQREAAVKNLKTAERFGGGEHYTAVERTYRPEKKTITEAFTVVSADKRARFLLQYRLYRWPELLALLTEAGFTLIESFADHQETPRSIDSPMMIAVCQKPG